MSNLSNVMVLPAGEALDSKSADHVVAGDHTDDLRGRAVRGAFAAGSAQGAAIILRTLSMIAMARLLFPADFGLVGMVTAVTGFMAFFHDFGLGIASVQRVSVTNEQVSTLFWVNLAAGLTMTIACVLIAPVVVRFYGEQRLLSITIVLGTGFLLNSAGVQHRAMLQRGMRFGALAVVDTLSLTSGILVGLTMAWSGFGYWALVMMTITPALTGAVGTWIATGWVPGPPRRRSGIRSMLGFGGTVTANSLVVYLAYNVDKILLGRFWGPNVLGIYGRAYQLINIPTENLNSTLSQVALPALAKIQGDPQRLRSYFLQGYGLFLAIVVPITFACALFADDVIRVFLGQRWQDAAPIFRLLAPTILVFAAINPLGWLMLAIGRQGRSLQIAFALAPVVTLGYCLGLPWGANGVAAGFSGAMIALAAPVIWWARRGTLITIGDVLAQVAPPLGSIALAAVVTLVLDGGIRELHVPLMRLVVETAILLGTYAAVLLFAMKRWTAYSKIVSDLRPRSARA
jgi:O-antigen/teichoic acid export membrane protein